MSASEGPHADLIASARTDISDADRCNMIGVMPAVHQLHRRLRQVTDALAALGDTVSRAEYRQANTDWRNGMLQVEAERDALAALFAEIQAARLIDEPAVDALERVGALLDAHPEVAA